jgi:hypothetical protein
VRAVFLLATGLTLAWQPRCCFIGSPLPHSCATYGARQLAGLDYIMWSCKQRGIMLLLTLGNLWNAYKGPGDFLAMATGTAGESCCCVAPMCRTSFHAGLCSRACLLGDSVPRRLLAVARYMVVQRMACASGLGWVTSCGVS